MYLPSTYWDTRGYRWSHAADQRHGRIPFRKCQPGLLYENLDNLRTLDLVELSDGSKSSTDATDNGDTSNDGKEVALKGRGYFSGLLNELRSLGLRGFRRGNQKKSSWGKNHDIAGGRRVMPRGFCKQT